MDHHSLPSRRTPHRLDDRTDTRVPTVGRRQQIRPARNLSRGTPRAGADGEASAGAVIAAAGQPGASRPRPRRARRPRRHTGAARFDALVAASGHIVWSAGPDGLVVEDQPLWRAYTGQSAEQVLGRGWLDAVHPADRARTAQLWAQAIAAATTYETEQRLRRADGVYRPFLSRAVPVRDAEGRVQEWVGVCIDLTAHYHNEADLRATVDMALDAIVTINHAGRIVAFNPAAERIFGYDRAAVLGRELAELIIPPHLRAQHRAGLARYLATGEGALIGRRVEVTAMRAGGALFPAEVAITRIPLDGPPLFTGYIRDITERRQMEEALRHQALHDTLTGLPNRTLLQDRLEQALATAQRDRHGAALLLLDLDRFTEVNDTFGHRAGDALLREVAARLRGTLRDADTVARLGGDEFAVLLPEATMEGTLVAVQKLLAALEVPFAVEGEEGQALPLTAGIGVALYPEHGADAASLLRRADAALYAAKAAHRPYVIYAPTQEQDGRGRLALIADLRRAIVAGALALHYQPVVDVRERRVWGAEALVRWPHPRHGLLPPDRFIPLAEQTGLIGPLTRWALEAALRQGWAWQRAGLTLPVAVNVSMWDVHDPGLPAAVAALLQTYETPPGGLRVELTESAIMADAGQAHDVLTQLAALRAGIAVDDFGTGYSSLTYLKRLPVDALKIDRSFVQHMAVDQDDAAIVASTIGLGRGLGLRVVAEGVEDAATWELLERLGCDAAQGYYLGRPLPPEEFAAWLRAAPWRRASGARWRRASRRTP